jgi:hypothetical protein
MYDAVADEYCYPGTTVLKNKLDLRDAAELADFEAKVSDARADEVPGRLRLSRRNTHGPHFEGREHVLLPGKHRRRERAQGEGIVQTNEPSANARRLWRRKP